jgi:CheY-like chemotaxis protein
VLLVVDDEEGILSALRRALRREGLEILTAGGSAEALARLGERQVDAILSDHKMPGGGGLELLERAARLQPRAARLLLTGWPDEIPPERVRALGIRAVVPKPWDDAELRAVLRKALG